MSVTLKDIAKKAGVSISTVSRIINNDPMKRASKETSDKVWKIVQELGYLPNQNARKLIKGHTDMSPMKTKAIGCIFTSTADTYTDPFFSQIAMGVQQEVSDRGYVMGYSFSSYDMSDAALYNNISANQVDGAIILGRFNKEVLNFFKGNIKNLVYAGVNYVDGGIDEVICDGYKGACTAIEHLISLGHKQIGFLGTVGINKKSNLINEHRFSAYMDTMKKHQIPINQDLIWDSELSTLDAYRNMGIILKQPKKPTALFCANDAVAIGAIKAINEKGIEIPNEIAIVGLDDIEMASYITPPLTTIHVPKEELGKFAVKILIDRIEGGHDIPVRVNVPYHLVVRESCGGKK